MSRPPPSCLCVAPTPLDAAPRLSETLGLEVLVKRDDLTGLALGGNKARKLVHLVTDAIARGCDVLVTAGEHNRTSPG
jgi:D-cysteine desulfhydrase